jgi:hypothetical protein
MSDLARKNLGVERQKVRALARRRMASESEPLRETVDFALAAEEVMLAVRELHARGGLNDVFGRLPDELAAESATSKLRVARAGIPETDVLVNAVCQSRL